MAGKRETYKKRRSGRKKNPNKITLAGVISCFVLLFVIWGASSLGSWFKGEEKERYEGAIEDYSCLLDVAIPDETTEIKLKYEGFDISFNPAHHEPNYASWELTADKANGTMRRESKFAADPDVFGCPTLDDYRNSGFDRGHMAPAGDMKWSRQAMKDSHLLTNMCPQDHALNGGRWSTLENKCRDWARRDSLLIIICGPVLTDRMPLTIGESKISVPERFFKVILSPTTVPPRAIGFIMPNSAPAEGLEALAVSVDQVEEITGFDFFHCLPDDIEAEVEGECNFRAWNRKKK